jgi:molybdenum cofactor cytidylyltransferase
VLELAVMSDRSDFNPKVAAVVLAAGGSTRMGEPKQLLMVRGRPMLRRVAEAVCAIGLEQVVVVVGAHREAVMKALDGLSVTVVVNEDWCCGLSSSLRAGIGALRPDVQAALFVLADQPALTPELLNTLVSRYRETGAPIVAPVHDGKRGNPVLFDRALFRELMAVEGDSGGRQLLKRHEQEVDQVETMDPAVLMDIDTWQDYERLAERCGDD